MSAVNALHSDVKTMALLTKKVLESIQYQAVGIGDAVKAKDDPQRVPTSTVGQPHELIKVLLERNKILQENLKNLEEHQKLQAKIVEVQNETAKRNEALSELVTSLKKAEETLSECTEKGRKRLKKLQEGAKNPVNTEDLLRYARKVSFNISAPPGFKAGDQLLSHCLPAPPEEAMRMGSLYRKIPDTDMIAAAAEDRDRRASQPEAFGLMGAFSPRRSPQQRKRNISQLFSLDQGAGVPIKQPRVEEEESSNSTSDADSEWD